MMNMNIIKLSTEELENITGGYNENLFILYAEYLDSLYEKYNVSGLKNLKKICTPEERAKIKEMWHVFVYDISENNSERCV